MENNSPAVIGVEEDIQTFRAFKPHNRFNAWKGRDYWHRDIGVQIRLEPTGKVFLSTNEGHVSTLRIAEITLEELHVLIRKITSPE